MGSYLSKWAQDTVSKIVAKLARDSDITKQNDDYNEINHAKLSLNH